MTLVIPGFSTLFAYIKRHVCDLHVCICTHKHILYIKGLDNSSIVILSYIRLNKVTSKVFFTVEQ